MRILIDLQCCQSGSRFGGIGRYSMSLAKAMVRLATDHEFLLLLNTGLPNENAIRAEFADLLPQQNILTFDLPAFVAAENELPTHTRMAELIREKRIVEINPDVLHIASLFEGAGEDVVTSVGLLFPAERTAVTLYDLIPYLEQETYLKSPVLADHYLRKFAGLQCAGMIVSISEFSRLEALAHTTIDADRIVNISSAVDGQFAPMEISAASRDELLGRSGIERPFLLFTGSFDIRKNHDRLVQAFASLPKALRLQYQLVIVGKGEVSQIERLKAAGRSLGLQAQDLVFVGHVTDADLVRLYNLCTLFVFPSLREGFGLPVLEAMSCGVATIGSNRTSVPEVIGREDALFDPENAHDIATKMAAVLGDDRFCAELKRHGLARAKHFSWELSAKRALEYFAQSIAIVNAPTNSIRQAAVSTPPTDIACIYENFTLVLSKLKLGRFDSDFLACSARAIAANELRTRIERGNFAEETSISWVTAWKAEVGLASCMRALLDGSRWKATMVACYSGEKRAIDSNDAICCWTGKDGVDSLELQDALNGTFAEIVVVQFDYRVFTWLALTRLIAQQKMHRRQVFVFFEQSVDLLAAASETGKFALQSALKSCDGIFVQSMDDVNHLEALRVSRNVHFLPIHGSLKPHMGTATSATTALQAKYFQQMLEFVAARGSA